MSDLRVIQIQLFAISILLLCIQLTQIGIYLK